MLYNTSILLAVDKFKNAILNPEDFMDSKEKIDSANFYLSITSNYEFKIFLRHLALESNKQLMENGSCVWQKNGDDKLIDNAIDFWDIPTEIIPDNLRFEINRENFEVFDLVEENNKQCIQGLIQLN